MKGRETSASSAEIHADIRRTRSRIDDTLHAIADNLHPQHLLGRLASAWRHRGEGGSESGDSTTHRLAGRARSVGHGVGSAARDAGVRMGSVARDVGGRFGTTLRDHPGPALLIGAGVAWFLLEGRNGGSRGARTGIGEQRMTPERMSAGGSKASAFAEQVQSRTAGFGQSVSGAASRGVHGVGDAARSVKGRAMHLAQRARHGLAGGRDAIARTYESQPVWVGLGALALGLVVGSLIPRTRREDEAIGPYRDNLMDRARGAGRDVVERTGRAVERAVEAAAEEAREQGLSASAVAARARAAARRIEEAVRSAASEEGLSAEDVSSRLQRIASEARRAAREEAAGYGSSGEGQQGGGYGYHGSRGESESLYGRKEPYQPYQEEENVQPMPGGLSQGLVTGPSGGRDERTRRSEQALGSSRGIDEQLGLPRQSESEIHRPERHGGSRQPRAGTSGIEKKEELGK